MQEWRERREEKKCSEGKKGTVRGETEGREKEREFFFLWMLRASMQVLIKRIQKKRSQALLCGYVGEGHLGGLTSPPHLPVPCGASALFPRFATEPPSCTCVPQHQEKPSGQRDGRGLRGTQLIFFHLPSLHPCQAKLSRPPLRREVINFIYTLGPWNQRLSLWAVGVRGLWGSSWQPLLRFFLLIVIRLRKRQKRLGAVPPHPWGSGLVCFCLI